MRKTSDFKVCVSVAQCLAVRLHDVIPIPAGYKVGGSNPVNGELFNIPSSSGLYEIMRGEILRSEISPLCA